MKIHAAANRASKKDYYDLFELLNVYTFAGLIDLHSKMFPNYALSGTLKSMSEFSEVDLDDEPLTLKPAIWSTIKDRIALEIKNYIHLLQQMKINAEEERLKAIQEIINRKKNKN